MCDTVNLKPAWDLAGFQLLHGDCLVRKACVCFHLWECPLGDILCSPEFMGLLPVPLLALKGVSTSLPFMADLSGVPITFV